MTPATRRSPNALYVGDRVGGEEVVQVHPNVVTRPLPTPAKMPVMEPFKADETGPWSSTLEVSDNYAADSPKRGTELCVEVRDGEAEGIMAISREDAVRLWGWLSVWLAGNPLDSDRPK